jgi:hypothetical protein
VPTKRHASFLKRENKNPTFVLHKIKEKKNLLDMQAFVFTRSHQLFFLLVIKFIIQVYMFVN